MTEQSTTPKRPGIGWRPKPPTAPVVAAPPRIQPDAKPPFQAAAEPPPAETQPAAGKPAIELNLSGEWMPMQWAPRDGRICELTTADGRRARAFWHRTRTIDKSKGPGWHVREFWAHPITRQPIALPEDKIVAFAHVPIGM